MNLPDEPTIREAARAVVHEMCGAQVGDSDTLISSGLIDSLSILKLIARLETRLSVSLPPETLQPDDFDSIDLIVETVQRVAQMR
jgi:acyl carrier protein